MIDSSGSVEVELSDYCGSDQGDHEEEEPDPQSDGRRNLPAERGAEPLNNPVNRRRPEPEMKKPSMFGLLFRTVEHEKGAPKRVRGAPELSPAALAALGNEENTELGSVHTDGSLSLSQTSTMSDSTIDKGRDWIKANNPLFQSKVGAYLDKEDDDEEESVPLHEWFYYKVLNFLWPPLNYFRLHLLYILLISFTGSLALYISELGHNGEMDYVDALYVIVSACTCSGLYSVNVAELTSLGQAILAICIVLGSGVLLTLPPVLIRLYYFKQFIHSKLLSKKRIDEYMALWIIATIVTSYYVFWIAFGWIIMGFYVSTNHNAQIILEKNNNSSLWWALFQTISAFGNCGFTTFADNLVQWNRSPLILIVMSILTLAGNTAFPLLMRLIVWVLYKQPFLKGAKHIYKYLLEHPRRCFTHLFPSAETRWLLFILAILNFSEFFFELFLDWNSPAYEDMGSGYKLLNMYFQTVSIRTAGFNSIDLTKLSVSIIWLYTAMMYIAATPVHVTVRYTGIQQDSISTEKSGTRKHNTLGAQAQQFFLPQFFVLFFIIFIILIMEEIPLQADPNYSIFKVIFEVISGYGNVGLTLGYGSVPVSFSGVWSTGSKLAICVVMILGKHRGLPNSIDRAILMPEEDLQHSEESNSDRIEMGNSSDSITVTDNLRGSDSPHTEDTNTWPEDIINPYEEYDDANQRHTQNRNKFERHARAREARRNRNNNNDRGPGQETHPNERRYTGSGLINFGSGAYEETDRNAEWLQMTSMAKHNADETPSEQV